MEFKQIPLVWHYPHLLHHSASHSWASPTWSGFLPMEWRGVTLSLVGSALPGALCPPFGIGGHFLGCCLSALQVVASSLSALSRLQGGGGVFSRCSPSVWGGWLFFVNSLRCGKAQGSGCFLLVLEQASSSFVALCQLFSWSGRGRYILGSSAPMWGQTFFECTISAMEGYIPQMFYVSQDDGSSLPCFVIILKWKLSL